MSPYHAADPRPSLMKSHPFGKYLLLDRINVGGMAEVFMAKAFGVEGFERLLAIKRILPNMADDDEFINMFVDEARIAVQLSHANIVQIYELGKYENQYYIAMEYVSGKDLRQILDVFRKKQEVLPIPAAAFITTKICEGLDYAHRKTDPAGRPLNLIHRDVSPQNILVSFEGACKVTDFGIAKAEDRASKTQAGVLKGKFGYMSPEQVRGMDIDHRSDVFAVGILLYEMVTGKRLFVGESDFSTLEKVRNADIPLPREHNPNIPENLEKVMMKALAKERDERYAYASDLHDDLQQFLIEENTIYNAKRLAALLKQEFVEDIEKERGRMEEFQRVQAPSEAIQAAQEMKASSSKASHHGGGDVRAEKTMIFESASVGDLSSAPTQIGAEMSKGGKSSTQQRPQPMEKGSTGMASRSQTVKRGQTSVGGGAGGRSQVARRPAKNKNLGLIIVAATVVVSVVVLLAVLLAGPSAAVGTIVVTSAPTDAVEVYVDNIRVGDRTPITRGDIPVGPHTLVARSPGFADKAYRFELVAGAPAVLNIELERGVSGLIPLGAPVGQLGQPQGQGQIAGQGQGQTQGQQIAGQGQPQGQGQGQQAQGGQAGDATPLVEIVSEPSDAKVMVGGLPKGQTPVTLPNPDGTRPFSFEVAKVGFKTETVTVSFLPGEARKKVTVKLTPVGGAAQQQQTAARGKLIIRSNPGGATVFSGQNRLGQTPLEIPDLDASQSYDLRLEKDGFRDFQTTVAMSGKPEVVVDATLERNERRSGGRDKEKEREPMKRVASSGGGGGGSGGGGAATGGGGGGGGGGACSGSGAKISVMAVGVADCKVTVGKANLGVSPVVSKDAPVGKCEVKVICPDGKKFADVKVLKAGASEKIIIKPDMWK